MKWALFENTRETFKKYFTRNFLETFYLAMPISGISSRYYKINKQKLIEFIELRLIKI